MTFCKLLCENESVCLNIQQMNLNMSVLELTVEGMGALFVTSVCLMSDAMSLCAVQ